MVAVDVGDLYLRKSSKDEGKSVTKQERVARKDLAEEGIAVGKVFVDPDLSASIYATKARPDYNELIAHIATGGSRLIWLWEGSRGSRTLAEWATFLELCRKRGTLIRIQSHHRTYDVGLRRDWRTLAEEGVDAHDESLKLSDRILGGKEEAALNGTPAGHLLFGYTRVYNEKGKFAGQPERPDQADIVRDVFEAIAAGKTQTAVARSLNERGIPAKGGGLWRSSTIRDMVLNPAYVGKRVHQGAVIGPAAWTALVDEVTAARAVAKLTDPQRRVARGSELKHYLSYVPTCLDCDGLLGSARARKGGLAYRCKKCRNVSIDGDALEGFVEGRVLAWLRQPGAARVFEPAAHGDARLKAAQDEVAVLSQRLAGHYDRAANGDLDDDDLAALLSRVKPKIAAAKAKVERLSTPTLPAELDGVDIPEVWGNLSPRLRRMVIQAVCVLVVAPVVRGAPRAFDPRRLARSRWRGDRRTWGERWADGLSI